MCCKNINYLYINLFTYIYFNLKLVIKFTTTYLCVSLNYSLQKMSRSQHFFGDTIGDFSKDRASASNLNFLFILFTGNGEMIESEDNKKL